MYITTVSMVVLYHLSLISKSSITFWYKLTDLGLTGGASFAHLVVKMALTVPGHQVRNLFMKRPEKQTHSNGKIQEKTKKQTNDERKMKFHKIGLNTFSDMHTVKHCTILCFIRSSWLM